MMNVFAIYLRRLLLAVLLLGTAVTAFNALIDPYDLFRIATLPGWNVIKSQASQRGELFKRVAAKRLRPKGLILGNSRAEIGFDPQNPAWPAAARPVFNFALPGVGVATNLNHLEQVLTYSRPRVVLLGLDFLDFLTWPNAPGNEPPYIARDPWYKDAGDYAGALFSLDALSGTLLTVRAQHNPFATRLTTLGFNPLLDYVEIAHQVGYHTIFQQRDQENARSYLHAPKRVVRADGTPEPEFDALRKIIGIARQYDIRLELVIYPYHAHSLVLFQRIGLWPAFETWKTRLVELIGAQQSDGNFAVTLTDFSGVSSYSAEDIPPPEDTVDAMRWYWEAGHFKQSLGDVILNKVFAGDTTLSYPSTFGVSLTTANLTATLAIQRRALAEYLTTRHRDVDELDALVSSLKKDAGQ